MSKYLADLTERVVTVFVTGALAAVPVGVQVADWSALEQLGVSAASGGGAAVLQLLIGILARKRGNPETPSLLSR